MTGIGVTEVIVIAFADQNRGKAAPPSALNGSIVVIARAKLIVGVSSAEMEWAAVCKAAPKAVKAAFVAALKAVATLRCAAVAVAAQASAAALVFQGVQEARVAATGANVS